MPTHSHRNSLQILTYPYRTLTPVTDGLSQLTALRSTPGTALVWSVSGRIAGPDVEIVTNRPAGVPLLVVLPPADEIGSTPDAIRVVECCRPHSVLPYHEQMRADEIAQALRQPPHDLAADVTDFLAWRGFEIDRQTRHLIRRIVELSAELRSVSSLSRSLYLSRRALGRRFVTLGLPVPSHWLHFSRLLRVAIRLQNTEDTLFSIGYELGYPDGFSLSNQMNRLLGVRPSDARRYLGWEWVLEAWLRREADSGGLGPEHTARMLRSPAWIWPAPAPSVSEAKRRGRRNTSSNA